MNQFLITSNTRKWMGISLTLIIAVTFYFQFLQNILLNKGTDHVLLMPVYPLLKSALWHDLLVAAILISECYFYHEIRKQLRKSRSSAQWACVAIIVAKTISVVEGYFIELSWNNVSKGIASTTNLFSLNDISVLLSIVCSTISFAGIVWLSVLLIRKYEGRIRVAGYVLLVSTIIGILKQSGFVLPHSTMAVNALRALSMICMLLPFVFFYRSFKVSSQGAL